MSDDRQNDPKYHHMCARSHLAGATARLESLTEDLNKLREILTWAQESMDKAAVAQKAQDAERHWRRTPRGHRLTGS